MNRTIKNNVFLLVFIIYLAITTVVFLTKINIGHDWFNQWFFDKFFVFQFISIVVIGLTIEDRYYHYLSYIRIGSRKDILKNQLLRYYRLGFVYISIMFIFIILGALLIHIIYDSKHFLYVLVWYIRYLLGVILFINVMLCLSWSNNLILSRYCKLLVFIWLAIELTIIKPYIKKFFSADINLLFSWVFHRGAESYFVMLVGIVITTLLSIRLSDKRDFL